MISKAMSSVISLVAAFLLAACAKEDPMSTELPRTMNEKISITVDLNLGKLIEPGHEWMDNGGIVHVQGRVIEVQKVSGDLTGKFKILIANSERDPQTGNSKERWLIEFAAAWPAQKRNGVFAGESQQEVTAGSRAASSLIAKGKDGFAKLNLDVTFKAGQASADLLVGEGHIYER